MEARMVRGRGLFVIDRGDGLPIANFQLPIERRGDCEFFSFQ
jgi:hypothetical protein